MKIHHKVDPLPLRAASYMPLADQLDAAMKGFDALLAQGFELPAETNAWIVHCKEVKARFRK
jgi:hypothetical protein